MGIKNWVRNFFGTSQNPSIEINLSDMLSMDRVDSMITKYALEICADLISSSLSSGEFREYNKNKQIKKSLYYLFNVRPNDGMSAYDFWRAVIYKLIFENECLIISDRYRNSEERQIYIADSFVRETLPLTSGFSKTRYKNIKTDGREYPKILSEENVIYLCYKNTKLEPLLSKATKPFSELMVSSKSSILKRNARRAFVEVDTSYAQTEEAKFELEENMAKRYLPFAKAEKDAVLPVTKGFTYEELENKQSSYKGDDSRDYKALANDVIELVALALHIPPLLLVGERADTSRVLHDYLTFCIKPLGKMIAEECTYKFFSKKEILEGSKIDFDSSKIAHQDMSELSNTLEILFRTGAHTINENRNMLGLDRVEEEIANKRFVSKNYMSSEELKKSEEEVNHGKTKN